MFIETPRLIIRNFEQSDLEALYSILSDPDVMRFSRSGIRTKEGAVKFLNDMIDAYPHHAIAQYAVVLKESNQFIGFSGFFTLTVSNKEEIELSYRLSKHYWGRGYGTEAALACRDYAFTQLNVKKLVAGIEPDNTASIRVAEKAGLRLQEKIIFDGISVLIYSIER